jgi:hypothetical protein
VSEPSPIDEDRVSVAEMTDEVRLLPDSGDIAAETGSSPSGPAADEHRIAELGVILIGLILLQAFTLINVGGMAFMHIATGVGILGLVVVKLRRVINRIARYYLKDAAYREAGPPARLPRIMAPFLVVATFSLLFSGMGILISFGDSRILRFHLVSFWVWFVLVGVHLVIYAPKLRGILKGKSADPEPQS